MANDNNYLFFVSYLDRGQGDPDKLLVGFEKLVEPAVSVELQIITYTNNYVKYQQKHNIFATETICFCSCHISYLK